MFAGFGCGGSKKAARKVSNIQLLDSIILLDSRAYPIVTKDFEMFDFDAYEKRTQRITLPDGIVIDIDVSLSGSYEGIYFEIFHPNSYFSLLKHFRLDGTLKCKGLLHVRGFDKGVWLYFDELGNLTKEENLDEPFIYTFEDILKFCRRRNIRVEKGFYSRDSANWPSNLLATHIYRECLEEECKWIVQHVKQTRRNFLGNLILETITIDGKTGKMLSKRQTRIEEGGHL